MSPSCYLLRYVTMKVDSHVRRTTSANDDENADEPKVYQSVCYIIICMQDIWLLTAQIENSKNRHKIGFLRQFLFNFGWILALQLTRVDFSLVVQIFWHSWHSWHSWEPVNSGVKHILYIYIIVFWTPVISFWNSPLRGCHPWVCRVCHGTQILADQLILFQPGGDRLYPT